MSEASVAVAQDQLGCQVCLDLLKDPVTIPCGHSYCKGCITTYWGSVNAGEAYTCPQCRHAFDSIPHLSRNTILADMLEKMKTTALTMSTGTTADGTATTVTTDSEGGADEVPPTDNGCYAGPDDVPCDFCMGKKHKAVKSCLACLASYCENHLLPHMEVPRLKKHKLVPATSKLEEQICTAHDKLLEVFCSNDQKLICMQCAMDDHKGHDVVSVAVERAERQKEFAKTQEVYKQRIQEREKEVKMLKEAMETLKHSSQAAMEEAETIFNLVIHTMERRRTELKEQIRTQERLEMLMAETLLEKLEKEIEELAKRDVELTALATTEDHVHFIMNYQAQCKTTGPEKLPFIPVHLSKPLTDLRKTISYLQERLNSFCCDELGKLCGSSTYVQLIQEPRAREEFLQYDGNLTMDLNSANNCLVLSEGCKEASNTMVVQSYPNHPERFLTPAQVLCKEGITGRCYWEVEWSGDSGVGLAVTYRGINRKGCGKESKFGSTSHSWALRLSPSKCSFKHSNVKTEIPVPASGASRIGVYVDHRAGVLAFFTVAKTMNLLHRVQAQFNQPLVPGFLVRMKSKVKFAPKYLVLHSLPSLPNCLS